MLTDASPLFGSWRTKLLLAAGSAAVLLVGRAAIPPTTPSAVPASQERAAPLITQGDVNLGLDPAGALVTIPREDRGAAGRTVTDVAPPATLAPSGIGVAVSDRYVLTHAQALAGRRSVTVVLAGGREAQAELVAHELDTGLALLAWTGGTPLRPLRFRTSDSSVVGAVVNRLTGLAESGRGLPGSLGLRLQPIDAELGAVVGSEGVLVSAVEPGSPAAVSLRAGDVVTGIDDRPTPTVAAALEAISRLSTDAAVTVSVRRNGEPLTVSLTAGLAQVPGKWHEADAAPAAEEVLSPAQLDAARIDGSARVLAVNGEPAGTRAGVQRELRPRRTPALLYVQQDGERFFVVLK
jgi:S1-C subfamily serine protease